MSSGVLWNFAGERTAQVYLEEKVREEAPFC